MKQPGRIFETIQILHRMEQSPMPMDRVCGDYFRGRRAIGSKDRADIAERVYGIARHTARLRWWAAQTEMEATPRFMVAAYLKIVEGVDPATLFTGEKHCPNALSDEEAHALSPITGVEHADMPDSVRLECPAEHYDTLKTVYGDGLERELLAMLEPAGLTLRINRLKADKEKVKKFLAADEITVVNGTCSDNALCVQGKVFLSASKAWQKGMFEIQDEGSQLIVDLCAAKPGMQVLDYCAGTGGKTLALASDMDNKGRVVAMDIDTRRLDKAKPRVRRAGAHNVECRSLADEKNRKWLRRQKGTFDVVLVDAPCSGAGTWRRNPDMRWRVFGPDLRELQAIQAEILDRVAGCVKPGGKLVYATCSILPQENEDQVTRFLDNHPEFRVEGVDQALSLPGSEFMRLSPARHGTDGFFAAVLTRTD